jgi:hypothetical protein
MNPKDRLFHTMRYIANSAAEGSAYSNWPDNFARKECKEAWKDSGRSRLNYKFTRSDILSLDDETLSQLGFGLWSDELPIRLIPLWVYNYIADGEVLVCISGEHRVKNADLDLDTRGGCIAYGFLRD